MTGRTSTCHSEHDYLKPVRFVRINCLINNFIYLRLIALLLYLRAVLKQKKDKSDRTRGSRSSVTGLWNFLRT